MRSISERAAWAIAGALALAVVALAARAVQGGPLDPAAPPSSTRSEIEPRIAIHPPANPAALPIVLSKPGSYYLADNLTSAGNDGIRIDASDVTLDLNGFVLDSNLSGIAVSANGVLDNIVVRNGIFRDWDTALDFRDDVNVTIEHVDVVSGLTYGAWLGTSSTLRDCYVQGFQVGVYVAQRHSTVRDCRIQANRGYGVQVEAEYVRVLDNVIRGNGTVTPSPGVYLNNTGALVDGNDIALNTDYGVRIAGAPLSRVIRNVFAANTTDEIHPGLCFNCDIGPIAAGNASTSPYANLAQN